MAAELSEEKEARMELGEKFDSFQEMYVQQQLLIWWLLNERDTPDDF